MAKLSMRKPSDGLLYLDTPCHQQNSVLDFSVSPLKNLEWY